MSADPGFGARLCAIARAAVLATARDGAPGPPPADTDPAMAAQRATFVTLRLDGRLRGCIGSLQACRSLAEDVHENAAAAASRDPRFPPVTPAEAQRLALHVAVLGPIEPLPFVDERALLASLRPGTDGLLIRRGERQATFLPAVWQQLPEPAAFLAALKQKAGLPGDAGDFEAFRYGCDDYDCPHPGAG